MTGWVSARIQSTFVSSRWDPHNTFDWLAHWGKTKRNQTPLLLLSQYPNRGVVGSEASFSAEGRVIDPSFNRLSRILVLEWKSFVLKENKKADIGPEVSFLWWWFILLYSSESLQSKSNFEQVLGKYPWSNRVHIGEVVPKIFLELADEEVKDKN